MRKFISLLIALCLFIALALTAFSAKGKNKKSNKAAKSDKEFLFSKDLRRGMKGYGLSVFAGSKPTRFNVEIIGVINGDGPHTSLILARFSGDPIDRTGVIAGMSGSPVYIDGRLVGAVSHAFPWAKEPIGAIRPIEEMLQVLNKEKYRKQHDKRDSEEAIQFIPLETAMRKQLEKLNKKYYQNDYFQNGLDQSERIVQLDNKKLTLRPIKTPILFSGIDSSILNVITPELSRYGLYPIQSGSGGIYKAKENETKELNPGDAVGIPLITGDMHASPVGTVTYRKGKEVLIFGHPSFFKGSVDLPMSKEYVHTVIPSREVSFKLASTIFEVGKITQDRNAAVAGELGKFSPMIPVKVAVTNEGQKHNYNFKIVKDKMFFPNLLVSCIMQSVLNANSKMSHSSIKFKFEIKVKNLETGKIDIVKTHDYLTGNETQKNMFQGMFRLSLPLQALLFNQFVKTEVLEVKAELDLFPGWKACEITKIKVLKNRVKRGDEVPILITLKNYKGKKIFKKVSVTIPESIKSDIVALGVGSAKVEMTLDKAFSLARFVPKNYDHLIKILNRNERFNDLVVWIDIPEKGLIINGNEHPDLPSSMMSVMDSTTETGKGVIAGRVKKFYRSNYLIYGMQVLPILIEKDDNGFN